MYHIQAKITFFSTTNTVATHLGRPCGASEMIRTSCVIVWVENVIVPNDLELVKDLSTAQAVLNLSFFNMHIAL
jgi:hypothetical protein